MATGVTFHIPLHFEDLTRSTETSMTVNVDDLKNESPAQLLDVAKIASKDVPTDSTSDGFRALYSLISRYRQLKVDERKHLIVILGNWTSTVLGNTVDKNAVKVVAFFVTALTRNAEVEDGAVKRKYWDKEGREATLDSAVRLVSEVHNFDTWPVSDKDEYAGTFLRMVLSLLESTFACKSKTARPLLARCLGVLLTADSNQSLPATVGLQHVLSRHEHAAVPIAGILKILVNEHGHEPFASEFLRELARVPPENLALDTTAARSLSACLCELADQLPQVVYPVLSLFSNHMNGESYLIRNGLMQAIGRLAKYLREENAPIDKLKAVLEVLLEHSLRDTHAFTRSKALQTWSFLAEQRSIPLGILAAVTETAASRLEDRAAAVRKSAAQLLSSLLQYNPFGPSLRLSHFKAKLQEFSTEVEVAEGAVPAADETSKEPQSESSAIDQNKEHSDSDADELESDNESDPESAAQEKDTNDEAADGEDKQEEDEGSGKESEEEEETQEEKERKAKVLYYEAAVEFLTTIGIGLERSYKLLHSTSVTDVSEAIALFVTAVQFQVESASGRAVNAMLPLIFAKEVGIRTAVVNAYERLLAPSGPADTYDKDVALSIAKGLLALGVGATPGDIACLEELVMVMMHKGANSERSNEGTTIITPAVVAVTWDILAGKVPGATPEQAVAASIIVGFFAAALPESLQTRIDVVKKCCLEGDSNLIRWLCIALSKLPAGCDTDDTLADFLIQIVESNDNIAAIEHALNATYRVNKSPEPMIETALKNLYTTLASTPEAVSAPQLGRFIFIVGHVALKQLVRIEGLMSKLRKCAAKGEEDETAGAEADKALEFAESELVSPRSLLGQFGEVVRIIAADKKAPTYLRASAILTLTKFMCIEESYCKKNLQLLFTLLHAFYEPALRGNIVTALGDLAFRFPNLVEPWSSKIYASLGDPDASVRKNTLMALSHLILNDMVKVKGQIDSLALCILDKDRVIADFAKMFFNELSRKSANAVYNILPDTISCLSRRDDVTSAQFKQIMSFLIRFIEKDRQAEGLVEKLSHRFRTKESADEGRDLAYCIGLLNLSDRCIKKLNDCFKSYASALTDDETYNIFMHSLSKVKRSKGIGSQRNEPVRAESNQILEELLSKFEEQRGKLDKEDEYSAATGDDRKKQILETDVSSEHSQSPAQEITDNSAELAEE